MMCFVAVFMMIGASALFIAGGFSSIAGSSSTSDVLIYVGAVVFTSALIAMAISVVFWIAGYAIPLATHFMCVADKRRTVYVSARRDAQDYVSQYVDR